MLAAQTRAELTLTLRNGEQVLLTLVIPLALLVALTLVPVVSVPGGSRVGFFVPGVIALAVMSSAFTGQAIAVGFERQYGVLKRLGSTPLPRSVLLGAKTLAVFGVELVQLVLVCLTGYALGWHPHGSVLPAALLVVCGVVAFSGLGLLLGGTLRGLTALAAANLVWFALLLCGGVLFPLSQFGAASSPLGLLPSAALSHGLRHVLLDGAGLPLRDVGILLCWAALSLGAASRLFRWE
ncbi:MAG: ABC transporter permease [Actinomycetota bacterium]|nr:ABC transporter permease [Actinomycetota bacterium]